MLSWAAKSSPAWFLMPHTLDLVLWLNGRTPVSVSAVGSRGVLAKRGIDTWDVVHALVTFDDGSTATFSSAWTLPDAGDGIVDFRFQVIGTEGSVTADLSHQGLTIVSDKTRSPWPLSGRAGRAMVGAPVWMVQDFAAGLVDGSDLGPGVDHGVLITEVICAIEESIATGQTVDLATFRQAAGA
jgi:predicted dehydrogenase